MLDCAALPLPDGATLLTFFDATASANVERALTERNEALISAEKLRNDFVNHVSYELRTPLTNIIGFTQLLADGGAGPLNPKQLEYAGYIKSSSAALLAIINDILDLASIDAGALELRLEEVDVVEAMKAAAEGVQDRLSESHIDLRIVATDDVGMLARRRAAGAPGAVQPALQRDRLLGAGQTVTLAAMRRGDEVVFKVSDRGRGIPPEALERVFDRFESQTSGSRHRGPGLGLSIVRALVELHGGRVTIDSALGEGTTVTCIFPIKPAQAARPRGGLRWRRADGGVDAETLELADEAATVALARWLAGYFRAGRFHRALRRSRRRQDGVRARLSARADRRSRTRGAEPDLHADPELRRP